MAATWPFAVLNLLGTCGVALWFESTLGATRAELRSLSQQIEQHASLGNAGGCSAEIVHRPSAEPDVAVTVRRPAPEEPVSAPKAAVELEAIELEPPGDEEVLLTLDQAFRSELPDRSFQRNGELRLTNALRQVITSENQLSPVECAATLCRARLSLSNELAFRRFLEQLTAVPPFWTGASTVRREPESDGTRVSAWLYFAAEGSALPTTADGPS